MPVYVVYSQSQLYASQTSKFQVHRTPYVDRLIDYYYCIRSLERTSIDNFGFSRKVIIYFIMVEENEERKCQLKSHFGHFPFVLL
jgi:hypothetical protein